MKMYVFECVVNIYLALYICIYVTHHYVHSALCTTWGTRMYICIVYIDVETR